jgi:chromosome segregation ATPase
MSLGQKNPGHVNYRDSKLTRILKPSLSGNARMAVICCISPSDNYIDETRSTLQFATRAKLVKTNAVTNEIVESDAGVIAKLRLDLERSRLENERLESQVRELQLGTPANLDSNVNIGDESVRRELDNLKRFLFDDSQRCGDERFASHSKFFTDQDIISNKRFDEKHASAVKDDSCRPKSDSADELLRIALASKAKQVKELQEELVGSQSSKKHEHSRFSLAAYQDIDNYKLQNEELEAKLSTANSLIASLGKQIDELSSHKNDALDWIEELFAKSEQKDMQVTRANKERDDALDKCKTTASELNKTKKLLEFTIGEKEDAEARMKAMRSEVDALKYCVNSNNSVAEGTALLKQEISNLERDIIDVKSERDELAVQNDELLSKSSIDANKIVELEHKCHMLQTNQSGFMQSEEMKEVNEGLQFQVSQLKRQLQSQKESHCVYEEENRVLVERVELVETELSKARMELQVKSEELDDMEFNLERERKAKEKEIALLRNQVKTSCVNSNETHRLAERLEATEKELATKSKALDEAICKYEREKEQLVEDVKALRNRVQELEGAASHSVNIYELQCIKEENSSLKSELSCMKRQVLANNKESDELRLLRMQLKSAKQSIAECDAELRQREEMTKHADIETQKLRDQLERTHQRTIDAEKANVSLTKRDKELRESVSRVRELVDSLASENANLKEKNDSYRRKLSERDTRSRELENLFRSAMNERDTALRQLKESTAALRELKESTEKMKYKFESLNKAKDNADLERENMCLRLDKMAGEFQIILPGTFFLSLVYALTFFYLAL